MSHSQSLVSYLTNFAKTGDPNNDGLPQWSPYSQGGTALKIGGSENVKMGLPDMEQLMWTMKNKKSVGE
jgi:para-nitrobenzyl esterase